MVLHNENSSEIIISSNDILVSGQTPKLLTDVINDQDDKLNNLERNVKWLYKYGGTGSKGSEPEDTSINLSCDILFGNNVINKNTEKIILSNNSSTTIPLSITLKKRNSLNSYSVRITHNNIILGGKWQSLNEDNDYNITSNINITNIESAYIKIEVRGSVPGGNEEIDTYIFKYVTNPYIISLNILKEDDNVILNNNDLYYNVAISNNVKLKINYNLETLNEINYEILQSEMFNITTGIINEDHTGSGSLDIPINKSFLLDNSNFGLQTIKILFNIPYDENVGIAAHTISKELTFTYIPDNGIFFKVEPQYSSEKIYKYNEDTYNSQKLLYDDYVFYFDQLTKINTDMFDSSDNIENKTILFEKLNIDNPNISKNELVNLINVKLEYIENNIYIFNTGTLSLLVQAYNGTLTNGITDIKCILSDGDIFESIDLNITTIQYRKKQQILLPIHNNGIYKFSIYSDNINEENRIYYYAFVLNKDNMINWYSSDVTNNQYLNCYYRAGDISNEPTIQNLKGKIYVQQYSSAEDKQILSLTDNVITKEDILLSFGIQYSDVNNVNNKILTVLCNKSDNSKIDLNIYQNKITMGDQTVNIFLPKETDYNPIDKTKYHLLNIYKRYLYTNGVNYYEICVYLDGSLEGAFEGFTNDSSGWDTIIMNSGNYVLNLFEISYFAHNNSEVDGEFKYNKKRFDNFGKSQPITYLDDIAISEYYYKYRSAVLQNTDNINNYDDIQLILNELRSFKETENGMIEVQNRNAIDKIAENINMPVLLFNYNDPKDYDFISRFTNSYTEGFGENGTFILDSTSPLYYSPGKTKLQLISLPSELSGAYWYIQLQGSSTGLYFGKNLTLGINPGTSKGYMPIFTPNFMYLSKEQFDKQNPTKEELTKIKQARDSFLPETAFTLKADCVDSTHSNNTAIGKFINENTTPFDIKFENGAVNKSNCTYVNYIKNCLLGFGCLVFIQVQNEDKTTSKYYFLGIYNFNLGRDSYFNMGYYSPSILMNDEHCNNDLSSLTSGNEFKVTYITLTEDMSSLTVSNGVIVAEIQGGNPRYDFSQYNNTILLPQTNDDKGAMFGDFVPKYDPTLSSGPSARIRYHIPRLVKSVTNAGGFLFENVLHKHLGIYDYGYSKYIDNGINSSIFESANQVPNYRIQYTRNINVGPTALNYYDVVKNNGEPYFDNTERSVIDLYRLISVESVEGESMPYGRPEPILDYTSVSEYYTGCMAFGLVDSVMKNLNVKTWDSTYVDGSDDSVNNVGKWFIGFYDMDTAFGRNNAGTKTSYFAFSDYWKTSNSSSLEPATIYRDFYPASDDKNPNVNGQRVNDAGFDIPSSYLFAIAKYAPLVGVNNFGSIFEKSTPQTIWARWRYTGTDSSGSGPGTGELRNAKYFIDKYFVRNFNEIPEQLWTLNYRFKYLKRIKQYTDTEGMTYYIEDISTNAYESKNYKSFHGKGINELYEWLNGRFHILDAYFNLDRTNTSIKYLEYNDKIDNEKPNVYFDPIIENGNIIAYKYIDNMAPSKDTDGIAFKWRSINAGATDLFDTLPLIDSNLLKQNLDVYILQDIFTSSGDGQQYEREINLNIKAQEYSPLVLGYAQGISEKFLLNDPNKIYSLHFTNTGLQQLKFGGSSLWTYIENYNDLVLSGHIYVNSSKLDTFTLTKGICSQYQINGMKSLKTIRIEKTKNDESTSFTGKLTIGNEFPDLTTINLLYTNITLVIDSSGVQNINLSNTVTDSNNGSTSITNCNNLKNVILNGFSTPELIVTPGWSNNISLKNTAIGIINIQSKNKEDDVRTFTLENDNTCTSLLLEGFTEIYIKNCKNLYNIYIKDPENIKCIEIENCCKNNKLLHIYSDINETYESWASNYSLSDKNVIISLNKFVHLESFKFTNTGGFNILDISEISGISYTINDTIYKIIRLYPNAFSNTQLTDIRTANDVYLYVDGDNIGNTSTFNNTSCRPSKLIIGKSVKHLDSMFACDISTSNNTSTPVINLAYASVFLQNAESDLYSIIFENRDNIISMNKLFYGQSSLITSISDYTAKYLSLKYFTNVRDISYMLYATSVGFLNKEFFGTTDTKISNIECCIPQSCVINVDFFDYVINNIETLISDNYYITYKFKFVQGEGENASYINSLNIADIFNNLNSENNKLKSIRGFNISDDIEVNYDKLLYDTELKFKNLQSIEYSFNSNNINCYNCNNIGLNKYFNVTVNNSFNFSNDLINRFSIKNFINFDNLGSYSNFELYTTKNSLSGAKILNDSDIIYILSELNNIGCKDISYLFANTEIHTTINNYDYELILSNNDNQYNFTICSHLFESSKLLNIFNEEIGYTIISNSLKAFKKVTNWSYAFANCILHKNLPLNMFNKLINSDLEKPYIISNYEFNIDDLSYMFNNVKLDGKPGSQSWFDYDWTTNDPTYSYNGGVKLNGSYHSDIKTLVDLILYNPLSYDKTLKVNSETEYNYGTNIIKNLILPWDIFYGCKSNANIEGFISNSDFEGILPTLLFPGRLSKKAFKNVFYNTLVIPNYIGKYLIRTKSSYKNNNSLRYALCNTYAFVPSNFTSIEVLNEAFNFKVLLPNSEHKDSDNNGYLETENNELELYFIFNKDSFDKQSLSLMTNSLPIVLSQNIENKARIIYNIDTSNIYNDASVFSDKIFNSRYDYGIHYYMSLYDTEEGTDPNGENEDINGNKYVIDNNKTGLTFNSNGLLNSMKYTMFNGDMMALIYGSILNNSINLMSIQRSGNNSSLCTFSGYSNSGINLSYNIILPLNGSTNNWYEYAFATPRNNISISKKNIYNKNSESLKNYININTNKFKEEINDPNTGQSYD